MAGDKLFAEALAEKQENKGEVPDDLGPCASVARGRWVTALTIRHAGKPWESFQYRDIGTRSEFEPTRFVVLFEGRDERFRVVVKGRNLGDIYAICIQGRLEWIRQADRDFAKDGEAVITAIEVVREPVKG